MPLSHHKRLEATPPVGKTLLLARPYGLSGRSIPTEGVLGCAGGSQTQHDRSQGGWDEAAERGWADCSRRNLEQHAADRVPAEHGWEQSSAGPPVEPGGPSGQQRRKDNVAQSEAVGQSRSHPHLDQPRLPRAGQARARDRLHHALRLGGGGGCGRVNRLSHRGRCHPSREYHVVCGERGQNEHDGQEPTQGEEARHRDGDADADNVLHRPCHRGRQAKSRGCGHSGHRSRCGCNLGPRFSRGQRGAFRFVRSRRRSAQKGGRLRAAKYQAERCV
eukprot:scaffold2183_cov140-Isochrysis_galbana.AAC.2